MTDAREDWHYGDRYFAVTLASGPDSMDLELDLVGGRLRGEGSVMIASCDDESQDIILYVLTDEPLPLELFERFAAEARRLLPGRA